MKRKIKENKIKITYKQAENISEEEAQRRLFKAFDILLSETAKTRETRDHILKLLDKSRPRKRLLK